MPLIPPPTPGLAVPRPPRWVPGRPFRAPRTHCLDCARPAAAGPGGGDGGGDRDSGCSGGPSRRQSDWSREASSPVLVRRPGKRPGSPARGLAPPAARWPLKEPAGRGAQRPSSHVRGNWRGLWGCVGQLPAALWPPALGATLGSSPVRDHARQLVSPCVVSSSVIPETSCLHLELEAARESGYQNKNTGSPTNQSGNPPVLLFLVPDGYCYWLVVSYLLFRLKGILASMTVPGQLVCMAQAEENLITLSGE
jgi:hypothetical protein